MRYPQDPEDRTVFSEFNLRTPNAKYMMRQGDYKFCYYTNDISELYDLKTDPNEMRNLALLPESQKKVEEMRRQLFAWYTPPESNRRA
jgi:choline-sulfatase